MEAAGKLFGMMHKIVYLTWPNILLCESLMAWRGDIATGLWQPMQLAERNK